MEQQFNDDVGQVAGNNIINRHSGISVNARNGAVVHVHLSQTTDSVDAKKDPQRAAIHQLLSTCDAGDCRSSIEHISQALFGSKLFKSLSLDQLAKLQFITDELVKNKQQASKPLNPAVAHRFFSRLFCWAARSSVF